MITKISKNNSLETQGDDALKCVICNAIFSLKCNLKAHSAPVHEGNKLIKCDLCTANFARNTDLIDIQTQFMRERSHSNVKFVPVAVTAVK